MTPGEIGEDIRAEVEGRVERAGRPLTPALTLVRPGLHRVRWLVSLFSGGAFITFALASLWNGAWVLPADPRSGIEAVDLAVGINAGSGSVVEVAIGLWRELRHPAT
jgi:hypothetical protein